MIQTSHSKALLSPREACLELFGSDTKSDINRLYSLLKRGFINGERFGGRWYIPIKEINKYHGK